MDAISRNQGRHLWQVDIKQIPELREDVIYFYSSTHPSIHPREVFQVEGTANAKAHLQFRKSKIIVPITANIYYILCASGAVKYL